MEQEKHSVSYYRIPDDLKVVRMLLLDGSSVLQLGLGISIAKGIPVFLLVRAILIAGVLDDA